MTGNDQKQQGNETKRSLYPYATFPKSLEIAAAISDLGGSNGDVQRSVLAKHLGVDEVSASLNQNIMSAKTFGMIEGRGSYRLTETAKQYLFPTVEGERQRAVLKMLKGPIVFEALIARYDGSKVPSAETLVNLLHREFKITESWRPRVATLFLSSLRETQIVDSGGFLRYKASLHAPSGIIGGMKEKPSTRPESFSEAAESNELLSPPRKQSTQIAIDMDVWSFRIGTDSVRLETTPELSLAAWAKLNQYVQVLKPSGDN